MSTHYQKIVCSKHWKLFVLDHLQFIDKSSNNFNTVFAIRTGGEQEQHHIFCKVHIAGDAQGSAKLRLQPWMRQMFVCFLVCLFVCCSIVCLLFHCLFLFCCCLLVCFLLLFMLFVFLGYLLFRSLVIVSIVHTVCVML